MPPDKEVRAKRRLGSQVVQQSADLEGSDELPKGDRTKGILIAALSFATVLDPVMRRLGIGDWKYVAY